MLGGDHLLGRRAAAGGGRGVRSRVTLRGGHDDAAPAAACGLYLSKGRPVAIDGRLDWREWNAQAGTTRQAVQIIADTVQFLGPAGPNTMATDDRDLAPSTALGSHDDIPF